MPRKPARQIGTTPGGFVRSLTLLRERVPSFDRYPFCVPAIRDLDRLELHPRATFLIGENGSGKSTLIEALAVAAGFNPEGGSRNFNFSTRASHSELHDALRLTRANRPRDGFFLRAESLYNVASYLDDLGGDIVNAYGRRSLHAQSHGE